MSLPLMANAADAQINKELYRLPPDFSCISLAASSILVSDNKEINNSFFEDIIVCRK